MCGIFFGKSFFGHNTVYAVLWYAVCTHPAHPFVMVNAVIKIFTDPIVIDMRGGFVLATTIVSCNIASGIILCTVFGPNE